MLRELGCPATPTPAYEHWLMVQFSERNNNPKSVNFIVGGELKASLKEVGHRAATGAENRGERMGVRVQLEEVEHSKDHPVKVGGRRLVYILIRGIRSDLLPLTFELTLELAGFNPV